MSKQSGLVGVAQGAGGDPLFVDAANNRVGVGTSSPSAKLQVGTTANSTALMLDGTNYSAGGQQVRVDFTNGGSTHVYSRIANETGAAAWSGEIVLATNPGTSQGSALVERMRLDSAGRVTMPGQPAFEGNGSGQAIVSATYTVFTFNIEFNRGSHFNGTTFTAPVSGVYAFHGRMEWNGSGVDVGSLYLAVNGSATYQFLEYASGYYNGPSFSKMVSLSANDYVQLWTYGNNYNSGTTYSHRFGGYLVG